jgi:hypothetical protein
MPAFKTMTDPTDYKAHERAWALAKERMGLECANYLTLDQVRAIAIEADKIRLEITAAKKEQAKCQSRSIM